MKKSNENTILQSYLKEETLRIQNILFQNFENGRPFTFRTNKQIRSFIHEKVRLPKRKKLGMILVENNQLNLEQLKAALIIQKENQEKKLGEILIELGYATEKEILTYVAMQQEIPFIDLSQEIENKTIPPQIIARVPDDTARETRAIPIKEITDGKLLIAFDTAMDPFTIDNLSFFLGITIEPALATKADIEKALLHFYPAPPADEMREDLLYQELKTDEFEKESFEPSEEEEEKEEEEEEPSPKKGRAKKREMKRKKKAPPPSDKKIEPLGDLLSDEISLGGAFDSSRQDIQRGGGGAAPPPPPAAKPPPPRVIGGVPPTRPAAAKPPPPHPAGGMPPPRPGATPPRAGGMPPPPRPGATPPAKGKKEAQKPPGYGAPPPGYGAPPPGYGAPPSGYSVPGGYGMPPPTDGAPPPTTTSTGYPQSGYGAPYPPGMPYPPRPGGPPPPAPPPPEPPPSFGGAPAPEIKKPALPKKIISPSETKAGSLPTDRPFQKLVEEESRRLEEEKKVVQEETKQKFKKIKEEAPDVTLEPKLRVQAQEREEAEKSLEDLSLASRSAIAPKEEALRDIDDELLQKQAKAQDETGTFLAAEVSKAPTGKAQKKGPSILTLPFRLIFGLTKFVFVLPFSALAGIFSLAEQQAEILEERLVLIINQLEKGLLGAPARTLDEIPWFEKLLGSDAGQPGPLERFTAQSRLLLRTIQLIIGTQFILIAHAVDIVIEFVASYINSLFQAWNVSKTMARAAKRKMSGTEIEEIYKDFKEMKQMLSRLFVFPDHEFSTDFKPTFELELVLETRHKLAEMKRDLAMLTEKQMKAFVKEQLSDRLKAMLPNPLDLIPAFKDLFLLTFFVKYSREEIELMYIDLIVSYRTLIELKIKSIDCEFDATKLTLKQHEMNLIALRKSNPEIDEDLESSIDATREKIQRLIQTLCNPSQYIHPKKWARYDLIREVSKTMKEQDIHPKFSLELEQWLTQEVAKKLKELEDSLHPAEIQLRTQEKKELQQAIKEQKKLDRKFIIAIN